MAENEIVIRVRMQGRQAFVADAQAVSDSEVEIGAAAEASSKKMKDASFDAGLFGKGLGFLKSAAKTTGLALVAMAAGGAVAGVNFQQQMAGVASVTKATKSQLAQMSQLALHESTITRFGATDVANAMYRLGRAGLSTIQIIRALPGTLNLAHASGTDLATTTQLEVETLKAFSIQAKDSTRVADIYAKATQGGNLTIGDLAQSLKYVGATAKAENQPLGDTIALLKLMALHSVKGTQAGTSLRMALRNLNNPTRQMQAGLSAINIQLSDIEGAGGKMKPLGDILKTVWTHMQNLPKFEQNKIIGQIFGARSTGIFAILNQGPAAIDKVTKSINNSKGVALSMADTLNNTVAMQLLRFWHILEAIGIEVYMVFAPDILRALKAIDLALAPLIDHFPQVEKLAASGQWQTAVYYVDDLLHAHGHLAAALLEARHAFQVVSTTVKTILFPVFKTLAIIVGITLYGAFVTSIAGMQLFNHNASLVKAMIYLVIAAYTIWKAVLLYNFLLTKAVALGNVYMALTFGIVETETAGTAAALVIYNIASEAAAAGTLLLGLAMDALPFVAIVAGVVLIGYGLRELYVKWAPFRELVNWTASHLMMLFDWVKGHWPLLVALIGGPFGLVALYIITHWKTVESFFENFPSRMKSLGTGMWDWIKAPFVTVINWIISQLDKIQFSIPGWVPGIGGDSFGINIPKIGVNSSAGGGSGINQIGGSTAQGFLNTHGQSMTGLDAMLMPTASVGNLPPKKVEPITQAGDPSNPFGIPPMTAILQLQNKTVAEAVFKHKGDKAARK